MKIRPKIILVVEDNSDDEALLMRQLRKADMDEHVKIVRDGGDALEFLNRDSADLSAVFLDLNLPNVTGLQTLQAIRNNELTQDLPVIIMTSSHSQEELEECRRLGTSGYVPKPLTFASFAKAFADVFHARRNAVSA